MSVPLTLFIRSVSLMEPEPRAVFAPSSPQHMPSLLTGTEIPTSIRGDPLECSPPKREHQRNNCPGGIGLMASELSQPELCRLWAGT